MAYLKTASDIVNQDMELSFMTLQPVGLTNTQCKALGPYFTRHPCHIHTIDEFSVEDIRHWTFIAPHHRTDLEACPDVVDPAAEIAKAVLISSENDALVRAAGVDGLLAAQEFFAIPEMRDAVDNVSAEDADIAIMIQQATIPAAVVVPVANLGHPLLRAISVALCGSPCLWKVLMQVCLDLVSDTDDDDVFVLMKHAQTMPAEVHEFCKLLAAGVSMPTRFDDLLLLLLSNALLRPIVFLQDRGAPKAYFPFLTPADSGATSDVVFISPSGAVVRTGEGDLQFATPSKCFPADTLAEYCGAQADDALVVLDNGGAWSGRGKNKDREMENACRALESASGNLCFASFPATYFAVADEDASAAEQLLSAPGFGRDAFASEALESVLATLTNAAALEVDADGHCLLHAVSRCLVGKEYLWHALRAALHEEMATRKDQYIAVLKRCEVLQSLEDEWEQLTARAHPNYSQEGNDAVLCRGLGWEHVFILANMLRRPIVLFDRHNDPHAQGFVFLPLLHAPERCTTKKVLGLAWSSSAHIHYVPVVPILGSAPAYISFDALPKRSDDTGAVSTIPFVNADESNRLLKEYIAFDDGNRCVLGGEEQMDIRPWCSYIQRAFTAKTHMSTWSLHEALRCYVDTNPEHLQLVLAATPEWLEATAVRLVAAGLHYCYICTRVSLSSQCCFTSMRTFLPEEGRFNINHGDRLPIKSAKGYDHMCCGYKHWVRLGRPLRAGIQVSARDYCSGYCPATVVAVHEDNRGIDVQFRDGSVRYNTPIEDVWNGFSVDTTASSVTVLFRGAGTACKVGGITYIDSDPKVVTDLDERVQLALETMYPTLPPHARSPERMNAYRTEVMDQLQYHKRQFLQTATEKAKRKKRATATVPDVDMNSRPPILADEDGNPVRWQSIDPMTREAVPYDEAISGYLEAAYQAKETMAEITIPGITGVFVVDFIHMVQENSQNFCRAVVRKRFMSWACPACTFLNEAMRARCEMCHSAAPLTAAETLANTRKDDYLSSLETRADDLMDTLRQWAGLDALSSSSEGEGTEPGAVEELGSDEELEGEDLR